MHFLITLLLLSLTGGVMSARRLPKKTKEPPSTGTGASVCPLVTIGSLSLAADSNACTNDEKKLIRDVIGGLLNEVIVQYRYEPVNWKGFRRMLRQEGDRQLQGGYYCQWGCRRRLAERKLECESEGNEVECETANGEIEIENGVVEVELEKSMTGECNLSLNVVEPLLESDTCKKFVLSAACTVSV